MTLRTVLADNGAWRFAPEDPPPLAMRSQAILRARVVDEVTGQPPLAPLAVRTTLRGAMARAGVGGRVGVVGRPAQLFPDVGVALAEADLTVSAPGFLPLAMVASMGAQAADYPASFSAPDLGDMSFRRHPTRFAGRVASRSAGPLSAASVTITGVWPRLDGIAAAPAAANAMPLLSGAYRDRGAGASLQRRNFTLAAQVKTLARPALAGEDSVVLSDRQGIAAAQVLAIEPGDPERVEFVGVTAIDTGSSPDQPARFTLDHPLRRDHNDGVACVRAVPGAGGGANAMIRPIRAGDVTAWSSGLAGIGAGTTGVELSGGGAPPEYHASQTYAATTGPQGDYRLPPIHRIAHVRLRATHGSQPQPSVAVVTLEWGVTEVLVDFLFP